jgi:hypothetical protein
MKEAKESKQRLVAFDRNRIRFSMAVAGQKKSVQFAEKDKSVEHFIGKDKKAVEITYKDLGP